MRSIGVTLSLTLLWPHVFLHAQVPQPSGDIAPAVVVAMPSQSLEREQPFTILLPAGYAESRQRYPVLYLLHGGGQDHTAFATRSWFRAQASRNMIIVTPNAGDSWYVNSVADPKSPLGHSWDLWDGQLVNFIDTLSSRWGKARADQRE